MTPITRLVSRVTLPLALLISMTHLAGAETGPGDGFTAGIITALGLTFKYLAYGYGEARRRFVWVRYPMVMAAGIVLALVVAAGPLVAGVPLLGELEVSTRLPLLGEVRLTRALLFDLGIYFTVAGGSMTAIDQLRLGGE